MNTRTTPTIEIYGGSGEGCTGWTAGQVIYRRFERAYLYVMSATEEYVARDGMSLGVGAESGYVYAAVCREATDAESAPLRAAREMRMAQVAARRALLVISQQIRYEGTRPERMTEMPVGHTVALNDPLYTMIVSDEHVWTVQANGSDGDNWAVNNAPGCIVWRMPATTERVAEIRALAATAAGII